MNLLVKKINFVITLFIVFLLTLNAFSKESDFRYSRDNVSNYFLGTISNSKNNFISAYKYLNKAQSIKKNHTKFNSQFIHTLIFMNKFDQAFKFSRDIWKEEEYFFEADLLLGLESLLKKNYEKAEKHFSRLNKISSSNLIFFDFIDKFLLSWVKAAQGNSEDSIQFLNKIPERFNNLKKIQNAFLQCYFETSKTEIAFENLINTSEYNFSRYNFFLINYFLHKNKEAAAEIVISKNNNLYNANLLIKETKNFMEKGEINKIKNLFNCKNPSDPIAEIFYVIANLYSSQNDYKLSNLYLNISLFLNNKFLPNKALLAENFFVQEKYEYSKKVYLSMKSIGPVYSWHAARNISIIFLDTDKEKKAVSNLKKEFDSIVNPKLEHYYEFANFYKSIEYYKESIKYFSLALSKIKKDHSLYPKILDRRGTSYERMGDWENAEKDLSQSLKILPDQAHVLNYLAYSWVDKKINIEKSLVMLKKAVNLKKNDGYIIDSLGWAYYVKKDYITAEKFLQRAVELLPQDPVINDHYADALWMTKKNIQARYVWKYVLNLDDTEEELKKNINKKLVFGLNSKL